MKNVTCWLHDSYPINLFVVCSGDWWEHWLGWYTLVLSMTSENINKDTGFVQCVHHRSYQSKTYIFKYFLNKYSKLEAEYNLLGI